MDNNRYFGGNQNGRTRRPANNYDYFNEGPRRPQQGEPRGRGPSRAPKKKRLSLPLLIFLDVILGALILLVFYITNYVINWQTEPSSLPKPSWLASAPAETTDNTGVVSPSAAVSQETAPTTAASVDPNNWRAKFPDKFTDGAKEQTDTSYKDGNINVSINKVQENGVTYFVADMYVAELKYFKTAFPKNSDKMGDREGTDKIAQETNAIIAVNGDHCVDNPGPVVRNGNQYRLNEKAEDALVMNYDGSMQAYTAAELDLEKIKTEGAYQVWTFGPMLLKDGQPMTEFNSPQNINGKNPRTAIGYYEPGHYCFVVVDGRQPGYSDGLDMSQLSQLFASLGCKVAFNLDGGQSSEMAFMGSIINQPYNGGRSTTDILYVGE